MSDAKSLCEEEDPFGVSGGVRDDETKTTELEFWRAQGEFMHKLLQGRCSFSAVCAALVCG